MTETMQKGKKRNRKKRKETKKGKGKEIITPTIPQHSPIIHSTVRGRSRQKKINRSDEEIPGCRSNSQKCNSITVREKIAPSDPSLSTEMFQLFRCHHLKGQTTTRKEKIKKVVAADET